MLRSAVGVMTVFASVALLLPAGSLMPPGAVIVAVLLIVPDPVSYTHLTLPTSDLV